MNLIIQSSTEVLINKQVNALQRKLQSLGEVDIIKYDLEETSLDYVLEEADTYPMWSDHKLIICKNSNFLSAKGINNSEIENNYDLLEEYLASESEFSTLVFIVGEKLDKRKKLVKNALKTCKLFELDTFDSEKIVEIVVDKLQKEAKQIDYNVANYFCARLNFDLSLIIKELEKLCVVDNTEITKEIIDMLVSRTLESNIFELTTAVVNSDVAKSYQIYSDLIMQKEEPIAMIAMIANQFRLILQVKGYANDGLSKKEVATRVGVHPYRVQLALENSYSFNEDLLKIYLSELCDLDYKIKSGQIDKYDGLELFLLTMNK